MDPIVRQCREAIRSGSRSFAGASWLLPRSTRESVHMLYAWCRYCDDRIDLQEFGRGKPANASLAAGRLTALKAETERALAGEEMDDPVFVALQRVVRRHQIPHRHVLELLPHGALDIHIILPKE